MESISGLRKCMCIGLNRRENVAHLRQWKKNQCGSIIRRASGDRAAEGVPRRALGLHPETSRTRRSALSQETTGPICAQKAHAAAVGRMD